MKQVIVQEECTSTGRYGEKYQSSVSIYCDCSNPTEWPFRLKYLCVADDNGMIYQDGSEDIRLSPEVFFELKATLAKYSVLTKYSENFRGFVSGDNLSPETIVFRCDEFEKTVLCWNGQFSYAEYSFGEEARTMCELLGELNKILEPYNITL